MYWYNVDLGSKCLIWPALEVIDEGGRTPCLDQDHLRSSPQSTQPLSTVGKFHMWIKSVQGRLPLHKKCLDKARGEGAPTSGSMEVLVQNE